MVVFLATFSFRFVIFVPKTVVIIWPIWAKMNLILDFNEEVSYFSI